MSFVNAYFHVEGVQEFLTRFIKDFIPIKKVKTLWMWYSVVEKQRDEKTKMKQPTPMYAKILSLDPLFFTCEKYFVRTRSLEH
jgi:hypothetical protein